MKEPVPPGYAEAFLAVQEKWKHSLNCWSAAPYIPARVLSNWYPIEEGIQLYGATYDSTEHFWQAVKVSPGHHGGGPDDLLGVLEPERLAPMAGAPGRRSQSCTCRTPMRWNFCATISPRNGYAGFASNWRLTVCTRTIAPGSRSNAATRPFPLRRI